MIFMIFLLLYWPQRPFKALHTSVSQSVVCFCGPQTKTGVCISHFSISFPFCGPGSNELLLLKGKCTAVSVQVALEEGWMLQSLQAAQHTSCHLFPLVVWLELTYLVTPRHPEEKEVLVGTLRKLGVVGNCLTK